MVDYLEDIPETPSGAAEDVADSETDTVTETEVSDTENIPEASSDTLDEAAYAGDPEPDDEDSEPDESNEEDSDFFEDPEKPEHPVSAPETVSGNSTDYLYGSGEDSSTNAAYESGATDSLLLVETLERQNDILYAGFAGVLFFLGTILGVLVMHGFRLRRV